MHLGHLDICLKVQDIERSKKFYKGLGFEVVDGNVNHGYLILAKDGNRFGLYSNEPNMFNFRGADLHDLVAHLKANGAEEIPEVQEEPDGSTGFTIRDPDGNIIYFNTEKGHDPDPNLEHKF